MSEDKTIALVATKDYSSTEVPAVCIDLKKNKVIGKITAKDRRVDLSPTSTVLSSNGEFLILSSVSSP